MSKIKWGVVQPLTGGMYIGARKAIGNEPEWVISYPGLTDEIIDNKTKEVVDAANENNLVNWLEKNDIMPDWYYMNRTMTQNDEDLTPKYEARDGSNSQPDIKDMDLVVAVPVCAGLSMASTASAERKDECNCQMIWMAKYVLNTIAPKVYIFENAPTLMSTRGDNVRDQLETIAQGAGYSVVYYKTDTKFHHNCQKRPRTFIFFFKHKEGKPFIPNLNWERDMINVTDFFNELKPLDNDPMDVVLEGGVCNVDIPLAYIASYFGENWREKFDDVQGRDLLDWITHSDEEIEKFYKFVEANYTEKDLNWYKRYFTHIIEKRNDDKGYWSVAAKFFGTDLMPACMYKNVPVVVHHSKNRLYTMREWLWTMGHPNDFNMTGNPWAYFRKIGQNVPANTARWVTSEAIRVIQNWDNEPNCAKTNDLFGTVQNVAFYDNSKQKRIW